MIKIYSGNNQRPVALEASWQIGSGALNCYIGIKTRRWALVQAKTKVFVAKKAEATKAAALQQTPSARL